MKITSSQADQAGVTLIVVLILLTVLLLGGLGLARLTEAGTLVADNVTVKDRALQVSEWAINAAYDDLSAVGDGSQDIGRWYFSDFDPADPNLEKRGVNWEAKRRDWGDGFNVSYVVERMCEPANEPITAANMHLYCQMKKANPMQSDNACSEPLEGKSVPVYRVTARVLGPRGSATFVSALLNRDADAKVSGGID